MVGSQCRETSFGFQVSSRQNRLSYAGNAVWRGCPIGAFSWSTPDVERCIAMRAGYLFALLPVLVSYGCATIEPDRQEKDIFALQGLHRSAQEAYGKGELDRAAEIYQKIISQSEVDADTWFIVGNIYAGKGDHDKALFSYRKSLSINSADARVWNNISVILLKDAWGAAQQARRSSFAEDPAQLSSKRIIDALSGLNFLPADKSGLPAADSGDVRGKVAPLQLNDKTRPGQLSLERATPGVRANPPVSVVSQAIKPVPQPPSPLAPSLVKSAAGSVAPDGIATEKFVKAETHVLGIPSDDIEKEFSRFVAKTGLRVETIKGLKPGTRANSVYVKATERLSLVTRNIAGGDDQYLTLLKGATLRVRINPGEIYQFRSASLPVLVYQGGEVPDSLRLKTWLRFVPVPES